MLGNKLPQTSVAYEGQYLINTCIPLVLQAMSPRVNVAPYILLFWNQCWKSNPNVRHDILLVKGKSKKAWVKHWNLLN